MTDLKSCPFCGGSAKLDYIRKLGWNYYYVYCTECANRTQMNPNGHDTVALWNNRIDSIPNSLDFIHDSEELSRLKLLKYYLDCKVINRKHDMRVIEELMNLGYLRWGITPESKVTFTTTDSGIQYLNTMTKVNKNDE